MGQPYRCLAAWLLVAFTAIALAAPEDANSAAACSDQRPNQPQQLRLKAIPNTSSIGALWEAPGNKACVDNYIGELMQAVDVKRALGCRDDSPSLSKLDNHTRHYFLSLIIDQTYYINDICILSPAVVTGVTMLSNHVITCWQH